MRQDMARTDRQTARLYPSTLPTTDTDGRFDALGNWPRCSRPSPGRRNMPSLDVDGNMKSYVSPAPGVNLRSYVGQQVGINGIRGYMPEQHVRHVMARHVTVVDATAAGGSATLR